MKRETPLKKRRRKSHILSLVGSTQIEMANFMGMKKSTFAMYDAGRRRLGGKPELIQAWLLDRISSPGTQEVADYRLTDKIKTLKELKYRKAKREFALKDLEKELALMLVEYEQCLSTIARLEPVVADDTRSWTSLQRNVINVWKGRQLDKLEFCDLYAQQMLKLKIAMVMAEIETAAVLIAETEALQP